MYSQTTSRQTNTGGKKMKNYYEKNWAESNEPYQEVLVPGGKDFTLYNYKEAREIMKLVNIVAVGGTAYLEGVAHRLNDLGLVNHYQLAQLEYILDKKYEVSQAYRDIAKDNGFKNFGDARQYFSKTAWKNEKETNKWKVNVLDVFLPTLMEDRENYLVEELIKADRLKQQRLNVEMIRAGVQREDVLGDLPNQGVTTAVAPSIEAQRKFGEHGPYVTFTGEYQSRLVHTVEAKIVNAWYFKQDEFRVPSREQQADELESLREWYQDLVLIGRAFGEEEFRTVAADYVEKFERLEELEIEVGTYLEERIQEYKMY